MSYDDKRWMSDGYRVRHKYGPRRYGAKTVTCLLCGCKRRRTSGGWEYMRKTDGHWIVPSWTSMNPPCAKKEQSK